ncbi:MAG: ParB N-terminal domain-containing protein [Acidiferrobacter thiooxydans]
MPIAGDRRTDPGRRCERGRLLPRVFGSKALVRVRMHDIRLRYPGIRDAAFADGGLISTDGTRGRHAHGGHLPLRKAYRHHSPHYGAGQADAGPKELASRIRRQGLASPLTVRPTPDGRCEVLTGWRRLLACRKAGLDEPGLPGDRATIRPGHWL